MIVLFHDLNDFIQEVWERPPLAGTPLRLGVRTTPVPHRYPFVRITFVATYLIQEWMVARLELLCGEAPERTPDRFLDDEGEERWRTLGAQRELYRRAILGRLEATDIAIGAGVYIPRGGER
jgi:hypothetical protein